MEESNITLHGTLKINLKNAIACFANLDQNQLLLLEILELLFEVHDYIL